MKRAYNSNAESERIPAFLGHVVQIDMQKEKEVRTVAHKVCFKLTRMHFYTEQSERCRVHPARNQIIGAVFAGHTKFLVSLHDLI